MRLGSLLALVSVVIAAFVVLALWLRSSRAMGPAPTPKASAIADVPVVPVPVVVPSAEIPTPPSTQQPEPVVSSAAAVKKKAPPPAPSAKRCTSLFPNCCKP